MGGLHWLSHRANLSLRTWTGAYVIPPRRFETFVHAQGPNLRNRARIRWW